MSKPLVANNKPFFQTFILFVLPLIATNVLQNLSGTINTIFVGHMLGVHAVAAIAVFFPILFSMMAFIIGLSSGASVLVGQSWGAKDLEKVRQVVGTTLFMTLVLGSIIALLGGTFTPQIVQFLGVADDVKHLSIPYVRTMLFASPLIFIYIIYTSLLRGVGDSVTPLFALIMTSMIGLVVTPSLIQGYLGLPKLGTTAPAIASILSNISVLLFLTIYLNYKDHALKPNFALLKDICFNKILAPKVLKLGIPTGIQMITTSLSGLVIVRLINSFGANATAAYGAINQVMNYIQFPTLSVAIAASIFASQAIGAGKSNQLKQVTKTAVLTSLGTTGSLVIIAYLSADHLLQLFLNDSQVIVLAKNLLYTVLWAALFFGMSTIFASIMRASGTVNVPMLINIGTVLCIELPCAYLFSYLWGLQGIWMAYALSFVCLSILQYGYYRLVWKKKPIQRLV